MEPSEYLERTARHMAEDMARTMEGRRVRVKAWSTPNEDGASYSIQNQRQYKLDMAELYGFMPFVT